MSARARTTGLALLASWFALVACTSTTERLPDPQRHQVESARAVSLDAHRTVERELDLAFAPGQALVLDQHYGDVLVTATEGPARCRARVEISATDEATVLDLERTVGLVAREVEAGLQVTLSEPARDDDLVYVTSASLEVFVPPGTPLRLDLVRGDLNGIGPFGQARVETGRGDLRLRRVEGGVIARSKGGDVKLRQCTGGPVRVETDAGMIALLGSRTETARLETGRGRIVVNTAGGGTFDCFARRGSVRLVDVDASVTVEAGTGLHVEGFEGELLRAEKGDGNARLIDVRATRVELTGEAGGAELEGVRADALELTLEAGKLMLTDVAGAITARLETCDVDAVQLAGPEASLETQLGSIRVRNAKGRLSARTGRGEVVLSRMDADVDAVSSQGRIEVTGLLRNLRVDGAEGGVLVRARPGSTIPAPGGGSDGTWGGWRVASGRGDLVLSMPYDMGFRLEARAADGVIDSAFPIVVGAGLSQDGDTLRGDVGGGGAPVELFCERGNIALRRQDP